MHLNRLTDISVPFTRLILAAAIIAVPASGSTAAVAAEPAAAAVSTSEIATSTWDAATWDESALGGIDREAFSTALEAAEAAVNRGDAMNPSTLVAV